MSGGVGLTDENGAAEAEGVFLFSAMSKVCLVRPSVDFRSRPLPHITCDQQAVGSVVVVGGDFKHHAESTHVVRFANGEPGPGVAPVHMYGSRGSRPDNSRVPWGLPAGHVAVPSVTLE
jgi:hypothetical protein